MKIVNLTAGSALYTSNAYLLTGTWNAIPDVNTLIDTGRDPRVIDAIRNAPSGVGKKKLDLVVLTHTHYDHTSMLPAIREEFQPLVAGRSANFTGIDRVVYDGEILRIADRDAEVILTPGHSNDSICLYCRQDGVLFSGDTPLLIHTPWNTYEQAFVSALEQIARLDIRAIYPGHGRPVVENCNELIQQSLENVKSGAGRFR